MLSALAFVVLTSSGWVPVEQTAELMVLRGTASVIVPVADVLPTERVIACEVAIVSNKCPGNAPGRTDDWWPKSALFATPEQPVYGTVTFQWGTPTENTDGSPLTDLAGYRLFVRLQDCDNGQPTCPLADYGPPIDLGVVNTYVLAGVAREACGRIQARNVPGEVGALSDEVCGMKKLPKTIPGPVPDFRTQ